MSEHSRRSHQRWLAAAAATPAAALTTLASSAFYVARTDLIDALATDVYRIHWAAGGYLLGGASGMALTRTATILWGSRRTYQLGLLLFAAGSAAAALCHWIWTITPARVVEGFGVGLVVVSVISILWKLFPGQKGAAMGFYAVGIHLAAVLGPLVGGMLVYYGSWRWVFAFNAPTAILIALLSELLIDDDRPNAPGRVSLDWLGLLLLNGWIGSLFICLVMGQYWGFLGSADFTSWLSVFAGTLTGFVAWELSTAAPLIDLRVFRIRTYSLGLLVKAIYSANMFTLLGLAGGYMVDLRLYQWTQAGLVVAPAFLAMAAAMGANLILKRRFSAPLRIAVGLALMALATWRISAVDVYTSKYWLAVQLAVWGVGAGLVVVPTILTIFSDLTADEFSRVLGVFNINRSIPSVIIGSMATIVLVQQTDVNVDRMRLTITRNRPLVASTTTRLEQRFTACGLSKRNSVLQARKTLSGWVAANAHGFAYAPVFKGLAVLTALGVVATPGLRRRSPSNATP